MLNSLLNRHQGSNISAGENIVVVTHLCHRIWLRICYCIGELKEVRFRIDLARIGRKSSKAPTHMIESFGPFLRTVTGLINSKYQLKVFSEQSKFLV
ncbi:hypothetical protein TNIN_8341 [Trichonephila inaurata madagascariensis]|uniref:Uncharacterized protein n=1 Tax=Trichonephila inaurata madagascariensis TaxID=2747483 RepID=A0A8X7CPH7_9ARAC|nr:hypothetical protein TNIN_8341 [Trichonephila inaurata madagascariensis]